MSRYVIPYRKAEMFKKKELKKARKKNYEEGIM